MAPLAFAAISSNFSGNVRPPRNSACGVEAIEIAPHEDEREVRLDVRSACVPFRHEVPDVRDHLGQWARATTDARIVVGIQAVEREVDRGRGDPHSLA